MEEYAPSGVPVTQLPPRPRIPRAQQRYLGIADLMPRSDVEAEPPLSVKLGASAHEALWAYLHTPGTYRSGPLFGRRQSGRIEVTHAARGGYPGLTPGLGDEPFALDPHYLLGWSDAVSHLGGNGIDWVGHWLISHDNRSGHSFEQETWLRHARHLGLVDSHNFLLILGDDDGVLACTPLVMLDGHAATIELHYESD